MHYKTYPEAHVLGEINYGDGRVKTLYMISDFETLPEYGSCLNEMSACKVPHKMCRLMDGYIIGTSGWRYVTRSYSWDYAMIENAMECIAEYTPQRYGKECAIVWIEETEVVVKKSKGRKAKQ